MSLRDLVFLELYMHIEEPHKTFARASSWFRDVPSVDGTERAMATGYISESFPLSTLEIGTALRSRLDL